MRDRFSFMITSFLLMPLFCVLNKDSDFFMSLFTLAVLNVVLNAFCASFFCFAACFACLFMTALRAPTDRSTVLMWLDLIFSLFFLRCFSVFAGLTLPLLVFNVKEPLVIFFHAFFAFFLILPQRLIFYLVIFCVSSHS